MTATTCCGRFLMADRGKGIVTPDGKLRADDPKIREAAIKSVEFMTNLYRRRGGRALARRRRRHDGYS